MTTIEEAKAEYIGFTTEEALLALEALETIDIPTLDSLTKQAEQNIKKRERNFSPTTKQRFFREREGMYDPARSKLHEEILEQALRRKNSSEKPMITILAGPPGVGKSWYKKATFAEEDIVETDPDAYKSLLLERYDGLNPEHVSVTHDESLDVSQMILDAAMLQRLDVVCESTLRTQSWIRHLITKAEENDYQTSLVFLHKPFSRCFADALARSERPVSLPFLLSSIQGYDSFAVFLQEHLFTSITFVYLSMDIVTVTNPTTTQLQPAFDSIKPFRSLV